jgi:diguanylate cyclase (GGDEF)-like protein/PAS domain S-box-containing protein
VMTLNDQFRDSEAHIRSVLDHVADGIITLDEDSRIESFNRAATRLFGYAPQEVIGQPFTLLVPTAEDQPELIGRHRRPDSHASSLTAVQKDGSTFALELDLSKVHLGTRTIHIGCLRDVSAQQLYHDQLEQAALHDPLTGLPNRVLFTERAEHALRVGLRTNEPLALLLLDLNGFKAVNDSLGHHAGDVLLKIVAERLTGCLRKGDTVARLGGDEFAVLPLGRTDLASAAAVVWKIQQALAPPFEIDEHVVSVSASIGIALAPDHGEQVGNLLRRADLAMYDAKRSGTGYAMFSAEQEDAPARRLNLLTDVRNCIARGELVLHYQPKIDLTTQRTTGVEALIRWNHPTRGLLQPGEFMPEVEKTQLILPITDWVVETALRQLHDWRELGFDLTMAINISSRSLAAGTDFFGHLEKQKAKWNIPAEQLTFELTEGALLDTGVPGLLERLKTMDERLSIDDFGTGYSSLAYLRRLPVVEIKADRSFVTSMATVHDDAIIVCAIIDLAHNLGLWVVAEGIEDEPTLHRLIEAGCDTAQGYYFSRPLPAEQLMGWLESSPFGYLGGEGQTLSERAA